MKHFALMMLAALATSPVMAEMPIQPPPTPTLSGTRLELSARGEVKRSPDTAVISTGVVTQAADAATAMRDNAARMARVIAALKRAGVADKDVSTTAVSLMPQYRYNNDQAPQITGYQASNQLTVKFRDIGRSGAILDVLVKDGANEISGPNLILDNPDAALDEARTAAIRTARARAEIYAAAAGMKVKRIVAISENEGMAIMPRPMLGMMAKEAAAAADTVIIPGEQSLGITLSFIFELQ